MSWKLPSCWHQELLCLPGAAPMCLSQSSWKPHRHLGCPPAFRMQCLQSGRAGSPFQEVGIPPPAPQLLEQPSSAAPTPPPRPLYGPPFLSSGFNSRSSSAARAVGDPLFIHPRGFHPAHPQASSSGQPAPLRHRFSCSLPNPASLPLTPPP